jgi:hypothetical protein
MVGQSMKKSIRTLSKIILLLMGTIPIALALRTNTFASDKSQPIPLAQVSQALHEKFGPVDFRRELAWEDRYIVRWSETVVLQLPHIFKVQPRRFDTAKQPVTERMAGDLPTMYVATSSDESKSYKLAGFDSSEQEFNRMVVEGPSQQIRTVREAESRGLLCAEIVYGLSPNWWVDGPANMQLKAAEHFFNEGHQDGLRLAQKWWKKFDKNHADFRIATKQANNGSFVLNLPLFWAPVETHSSPEIKSYQIEISGQGTCHLNQPTIIR